MTDDPQNIVVDILQKIQADISGIKADVREVKANIIGIREQLHTMEGNDLRQERLMSVLEVKVERIETRLDLRDS